MTLPIERHRAVVHTKQFLLDLCDTKKTPRVSKVIRTRALTLLRHYPSEYEMDLVAEQSDNSNTNFYQVFGKRFI